MDPAVISGAAGLAGAFLGASAALGGKLIDVRHARKAEHRRQTDELLASFWGTTDRLWRISIDLWTGIQEIRGNRPPGYVLDDALIQRLKETHETDAARSEAHFLLARMRLLRLDIGDAAERLLEASDPQVIEASLMENLDQMSEIRRLARVIFEAKAARLLK